MDTVPRINPFQICTTHWSFRPPSSRLVWLICSWICTRFHTGSTKYHNNHNHNDYNHKKDHSKNNEICVVSGWTSRWRSRGKFRPGKFLVSTLFCWIPILVLKKKKTLLTDNKSLTKIKLPNYHELSRSFDEKTSTQKRKIYWNFNMYSFLSRSHFHSDRHILNPIPIGLGHVTFIYGLIPPMAGRNRVKDHVLAKTLSPI